MTSESTTLCRDRAVHVGKEEEVWKTVRMDEGELG